MSAKSTIMLIICAILINPLIIMAGTTSPSLSFPVINQTDKSVTEMEIARAYSTTLERYRKVLPAELLLKIDAKKIEAFYIVERVSHPEVSEAGHTQAMVNEETGEVETITIEVRHGYRKGLKSMSFNYLVEHELGHAFAFMIGLEQAAEIGHSIEIEQLKFK